MTRKNQGEGDKDSARRFNDKETQFVKRGGAKNRPDPVQPGDLAAESAGKARAKRGDQDSRDAAVMRDTAKKGGKPL